MFIKKIEPNSFLHRAKSFLSSRIETLLQTKDNVYIALPGGSTPMPILKLLAKEKLDWQRIFFYQTDERIVNINNKENNFNCLNKFFFSQIDTTSFPMYTGNISPVEACENYINELQKLEIHDNIPCFDLIILGMGEDGHIASIFPNSFLLREQKKWVAIDCEKRNGRARMTLCLSVLINAKEIILLATGLNKIKLLEDKNARKNLPIETLINENQNLTALCSTE
jgi:6-phosphogluconolactonase